MEKLFRNEKRLAGQHEDELELEREPFTPPRAPGKCTLTHTRSAAHRPAVPGKVSLTGRLPLIQRQSAAGSATVGHDMLDVMNRAMERASGSMGQPLPRPVQKELEQLTGSDLSEVRVHSDDAADQAARALGANAFTTGQHIYFAAGKYQPHTQRGRRLLAHEVAHTVQQRGLRAPEPDTAAMSSPDDPLERQADEFGGLFASATAEPAPAPARDQAPRPARLDALASPQVQRDPGGPEETSAATPERQADESAQETVEDAPQETHVTHELIGYELRGGATLAEFPDHIQRMVQGKATGSRLRAVTQEHEDQGHRIIRQNRSSSQDHRDHQIVLHYAAIPHSEPTVSEENLSVNGVDVPVRGATRAELASIQEALAYVPGRHLQEFVRSRHRIVVVDWSGARHESTPTHRLSGGTNIRRTITRAERPNQTAEVEQGARVEITHTAMAQENGGITTILHEMGHVVYDARLTPRQVTGTYGSSVHTGPSEQPAYGYMYYVWQPDRLNANDRRAFDAEFARQGLPPRGSGGASQERGQEQESSE
jgi:hypothetical protein